MQARERMNDTYHRILSQLLLNAERDVRFAHADADQAGAAKARARLDTLQAAMEIYAASHKIAYGERPWPREKQPQQAVNP